MIDCEASGPCPQFGSLISFGAVVIEPSLDRQYRSPCIRPDCDAFDPAAYAAIGMSRADHLGNVQCNLADAIASFAGWVANLDADRVVFWSDNPAFDWQWINHGFATAGIANPFGHSARRLGDLYAGLERKPANTQGWKKYRQTPHDHDPLNDALGNAEAMLAILGKHGMAGWTE
ncbi:exonuclease [Altererythrobacter xixiisoli]|uniref:Exonuclease n=2 Tax=Croceibacterium xixiisoli TaxID=1476466 RepID=A0A6I4TRL1_9SPHN|nr:exonuclease [Croceibacterium xixiisoli]